jgi:hypothetical protein
VTPAPGPGGPERTGSLCTGYGGLERAVTAVLAAEVAWYAEHDPHAAVLPARWPRLRNPGDITVLDRALRLLIKAAALPGAADGTGTGSQAAA